MSTIHFDVPAEKKAAYVKAAQRAGEKLVPWAISALDAAASGLGLACQLLAFSRSRPVGMTPAEVWSARALAQAILRAAAGRIGPEQAEAAFLLASEFWNDDESAAAEYLATAAALGHETAQEWVADMNNDELTRAVERRRGELDFSGD